MFRFLFGTRSVAEEPVVETQREELNRLIGELNTALAALPEMPRVIVDPAKGEVAFDLPEVLPDEALALPAPDKIEDEAPVAETVTQVETDKAA